jgi:hypothetical protein
MNAIYKRHLRLFVTQFCMAAATTALIGSSLKAGTPSPAVVEDAPNTHNMLVFGEKTIYLSHLPMFDGVTPDKTDYTSPHRYQVILKASFHRGAQNLQSIYTNDRRENAGVRIYTLMPEDFVLPKLASGKPTLTGFTAKVFRGHLEKGGRAIPGLAAVEVKIDRVVHFRKFSPQATKPAELKYLLFGDGQETFLAHYISQPPDFDQVLSVKVGDHGFTDADLGSGIEVTIPGSRNQASDRLKEAQEVAGITQMTGGRQSKLNLKTGKVIYFEEGELLVPPTFDDTKLEQAKN